MRKTILLVLAFAACSSNPTPPPLAFPNGFLFGAAVAGFQVDMGCPTKRAAECEDTRSDWYQWVTDPRMLEKKSDKFLSGDLPSTGPGFYETYADDLSRARNDLGLKTVRLSIEWSRIFPEPTFGSATPEDLLRHSSPDAIAYYHAIFAKMKELGLKPFVTITHYTMPVWLHDGVGCHFDWEHCEAKGWVDPRAVTEAAKYAGFIAKEFGGEVDFWATENEPLAITLAGYLSPGKDRTNPPGLAMAPGLNSLNAKVQKAALDATIGQIRGHAAMYDAVKANDTVDADGDGQTSQVGLVFNLAAVKAADEDDPVDDQAVKNIFYLYNQLFLDATILGKLDAKADGNPVDDPTLANRMDWLGVNYYTQLTVDGIETSLIPNFSPLMTLNPLSDKTKLWGTYAEGLYDNVKWAHERYHKPMYVTENGASFTDPNAPEGVDQSKFLVEHLTWLQRAAAEGADVRGYDWWSLMDNYEWNHGMSDYFFGLYAVDKNDPTKARTRREVAATYARIVQTRTIPDDLATKYPIAKP